MRVKVVVTAKADIEGRARWFTGELKGLLAQSAPLRDSRARVDGYHPSKGARKQVFVLVTAMVGTEGEGLVFREELERLLEDYAPFRNVQVKVARYELVA